MNKNLNDEEYVYYATEFCATHAQADDETRSGSHTSRNRQNEEGEGSSDENPLESDITIPFRATTF